MYLLRLVVNCTVAVRVSVACCSGGPPSAVVHFLTRMTRETVALRSTAALLGALQRREFAKVVILSC